ncbi:mucoidy inhibitor MuiA family protein [Labedaea rhizosphaerae]|uniref:Uncharacterized protein (TIGR02231 family) n=1 Tax=Labedaea rhizosphaerae TaxID=598644 RepID=A0A4R6RY57_LABRH|nr:mucoidy inhibitor MuiA family protein [Labedaea rhizosphaerae]TDP92030.1 uncharacterized protein (TIGR02231 family) [Labedaea rhizosphaerae]
MATSEELDTTIIAVTVYPGQARVTRRGGIALTSGRHTVLVGGLPLGLDRDSVRVNGLGAATVSGVDVLTQRNPRTPDARIAELTDRRDALSRALLELEDADTVEQSRAELIGEVVRKSGSTYAKAFARQTIEPVALSGLADRLGDQLSDVLGRRRDIADRRRRIQEEHDEVVRELSGQHGQQPDRCAVAVELEVAQDGDVELEVSYVVGGASWTPSYDLRLEGQSLRLTWFAMITQSTGEDWPECPLQLSTARPAGTKSIPELDPWYLDQAAPPPAPGAPAAPRMQRMAMTAAAVAADAYGAAAPVMETAVAEAEHGTVATTYRPNRPVAVPADGTAHRTMVAVVDLDATLDHVAVPLRSQDVYLRATVTNGSDHALLPGRAALFHDAEFVGSTRLEPWAPGEELELTLGVDDRVRVERDLVRRKAGKSVLGTARRQEAEYRIKVANHTGRPAKVTVVDQLPVPVHEGIELRDVRISPEPAERTDLGELTWKLPLDPGQSTEITFGFRVDVAKGIAMSGWRD